MKLETLNQAWAFYENVKAHPIQEVNMANRCEICSVVYDKFFYGDFSDYLDPDEEAIRLKSFDSWAKYCADARVTGYSGGYRHFSQLPVRIQRECYRIAQNHPYCKSTTWSEWAHSEVQS
jgi:hypothetical protein